MTKDEAIKKALTLLNKKEWEACDYISNANQAADILEEALAQPEQDWIKRERAVGYREGHQNALKQMAQPEQEPVAWANLNALSEQINSVNCGTVYRLPSEAEGRQPLYTTPSQRTWVGLTNEEIKKIVGSDRYTDLLLEVVNFVEAKLKDKNT